MFSFLFVYIEEEINRKASHFQNININIFIQTSKVSIIVKIFNANINPIQNFSILITYVYETLHVVTFKPTAYTQVCVYV